MSFAITPLAPLWGSPSPQEPPPPPPGSTSGSGSTTGEPPPTDQPASEPQADTPSPAPSPAPSGSAGSGTAASPTAPSGASATGNGAGAINQVSPMADAIRELAVLRASLQPVAAPPAAAAEAAPLPREAIALTAADLMRDAARALLAQANSSTRDARIVLLD